MASREQDKAMNGLLRQGLARDAATAQDCPQADVLAAYYQRSLDAEEATRWELHFSRCARCREQLAAMVRADEAAEAAPGRARERSWFANPWMLVPAAAAALAILLWVQFAPMMRSRQTGTAEVATAVQPAAPSVAPAGTVARKAASASSKVSPALAAPKPERRAQEADREARNHKAASLKDSGKREQFSTRVTLAESAPAVAAPPQESRKEGGEAVGAARIANVPPPPASAQAQYAPGVVGGVPGGQPQRPAAAPAVAPQQNQIPKQEARTNLSLLEGQAAKEDSQAMQKAPAAVAATGERTAAKAAASRLRTADERSGSRIIHSPDAKVLWRIASPGFVELSLDGGATWNGQEVDPNAELLAGASPGRKVCWLVGRNGAVFVTRDARTWNKVAPPAALDFVRVSAENDRAASVVSSDGQTFRTSDAGASWQPAE